MLDTSSWPRRWLNVQDELHLDPSNVRLETATAQVEADIIEDLFDNENAFELVDAIAKVGFLTHELPVVVKRKGKYVVVEGNRRLAALKAIQNPSIVPGFRARVAALAQGMGSTRDRLAKIEVMVAPNQVQVEQLIAALHTSNPRKQWKPARQAAFFQAQIDNGRSYKQLLSRYPTADVPKYVLRALLVNRLKSAVSTDPELTDFIGSKDWQNSFSALTRILEAKDFRELTGITLDAGGNLVTNLNGRQLDAAARLIMQGMADRTINTRTINTVRSPRFTRLISEMAAAIAEEALPGTGAPDDPGKESPLPGPNKPGQGADPQRKPSKPKAPLSPPPRAPRQVTLNVGHVVAPDAYPPAIRLHLEELSLLNIRRTPNAAFLSLRALLEKTIKAFAEARGVPDIGATKHGTHGRAQLHNSLNWLIEYLKNNDMKSLVDPAKKLHGGRLSDYAATKAMMNALNHNHHFHADTDDVIAAWNAMDSLMRYLVKP